MLALCETKYSIAHIAAELDISPHTVRVAAERDPEFAAALAKAKDANTDQLEHHLHDMATKAGTPGNVAALFGLLKARRPHLYRDNQPAQLGGAVVVVTADALRLARERAQTLLPAIDVEAAN